MLNNNKHCTHLNTDPVMSCVLQSAASMPFPSELNTDPSVCFLSHSTKQIHTFVVGMSSETLPEYMYMRERVRKWELNVRIILRVKLKSPHNVIHLYGL